MKLLEFPHSHYCKKACWAVDYEGIPVQAVPIVPGFHNIDAAQACIRGRRAGAVERLARGAGLERKRR